MYPLVNDVVIRAILAKMDLFKESVLLTLHILKIIIFNVYMALYGAWKLWGMEAVGVALYELTLMCHRCQ
jgi:hypothetical protein